MSCCDGDWRSVSESQVRNVEPMNPDLQVVMNSQAIVSAGDVTHPLFDAADRRLRQHGITQAEHDALLAFSELAEKPEE